MLLPRQGDHASVSEKLQRAEHAKLCSHGPIVAVAARLYQRYTALAHPPGMPYAFVNDVAASWEQYERFERAFEGPTPDGLVIHAAGPTDEGFRIIAVWESEDAWDRFRTERLGPGVETMAHVAPTFRPLHATHVVQGGGRPRGAAHQ